jgi:hypothetical protein
MVLSMSAMQHNLDHYKVVDVDHFDGPLDFNGDIHIHL